MRPTLTLKKRPATIITLIAPDEQIIESAEKNAKALEVGQATNTTAQMSAAKPSLVTTKTANEKAKKENLSPKQIRAEANRLQDSERKAQRDAIERKLKPLVEAYLQNIPVMRDTVLINEIECFRPLSLGIHKTIFSKLREMHDTEGCSNTLLAQLLEPMISSHVTTPQYLQGILTLTHRFDLEGNEAEAISEKHKLKAKKALHKLNQKQINNTKDD